MTDLILILAGLLVLALGAEALVRGAARLAAAAGVSPLVIGLTVVAVGTSAPELVVSGYAALEGRGDVAVGNVVGSNVFNVLFVLGLCAAIAPLSIHRQVIRREVPILIAASVILALFARDGRIGLAEAGALLAGIAVYTAQSVRAGRREGAAPAAAIDGPGRGTGPAAPIAMVVGGLVALVLGARWLVAGAVAVARAAGVSEVVVGLTIVAAGTSLPEVAASVAATLRGERDIAVGNAVGSSIFNALGIAGVAGLLSRGGLGVHPAIVAFDLPVMVAAAVATLPLFFTDRRLSRWEGLLFLGYYAAYVTYLVLRAAAHDALPAFARVMWGFALPITVITVVVLAWRAARRPRAAGKLLPGGSP